MRRTSALALLILMAGCTAQAAEPLPPPAPPVRQGWSTPHMPYPGPPRTDPDGRVTA